MTRLLQVLSRLIGIPVFRRTGLAKLVSIFLRLIFSCQISPGAKIGKRVTLAYGGLGIVIHGDAVIGDDVSIGVNVVVGGNRGRGGVPIIGNGVFIGPGAKILGPISVGDHATIGANSVVLADVPPGVTVVGAPAREVGL